MSEAQPRLFSDFDGTAVELASWYDPRNWAKYPLKARKGYLDFLQGSASAGIDLSGVITRRPNISQRRWVTNRSIAKLGISNHLAEDPDIVLTGSESGKGMILAYHARHSVVGMLEDKPHRFGPALLESLKLIQVPPIKIPPILLGVVHHPESKRYTDEFLDISENMPEVEVHEPIGPEDVYAIEGESFRLDVVELPPFSEAAGTEFAERLIATTSSPKIPA